MRLEIFGHVIQRQAIPVQALHVNNLVRRAIADLIMPILRVCWLSAAALDEPEAFAFSQAIQG